MKFKSFNLEEMKVHYPERGFEKSSYNATNLIGKKFNHLTVVYRSIDSRKRVGWVCKCDCGRYIFYNTDKLLSGEATACGPTCPYKKQKTHELTGKKFGRLLVLGREGISPDGHATWKCVCDCGNYTVVEGRYLEHRRISSCGKCPDIIKSLGNSYINNWLVTHGIKFKAEVRIEDCKDKYPLIFDFVILDEKDKIIKCIEYQGNIHYVATGGWITEESVKSLQKRDEIKKQYCKNVGIELICIPYTEYNNLDKILEEVCL